MRAFTSVPTRRRQMGGAFPLIPFLVSAGARVLPHIARLAPKAIQSVAKLFKGGRSATKAITSAAKSASKSAGKAAKSASKSAGKAAKSAGKKAKDLSLKAKNLKAKAKFKIRDNRYVQRLNAKMRRNKYRRMSSAAEAMVAGAAKKSKKKKLFSTLGKVATVATLASALPGAGSAGKKLLGLDSDSDSGQPPPRGRGRSQQYYGSKRTASQAGLNAAASALSGMPKKAYRSLAQAMYRPTTAPFKSRQYKQALMNYRYFGAGKKKKKKKQKKKKTGGRGKKPKKKKTGRVSMNVMRQLARRRAVKDVFSF